MMYKIYKAGTKNLIIVFDTFDKVQRFVNFHIKARPDIKLEVKFGNRILRKT